MKVVELDLSKMDNSEILATYGAQVNCAINEDSYYLKSQVQNILNKNLR